MANYRYKTAEIEAMKKDILTHCECETSPDRNGNKSAWRLRLILEGMAMCCRCSKREEARRYRKLALFERLTTNDMPNWLTEPTQPATPAEMPQISTETAEAVNVSAEKKNEPETAKYRFTQNEIDEMKQDILGACEFNATALEKGYKKVFPEMGEYSALNIRRSYEGYINEFEEGSKNRKFYERRLALYESLTENDRPNFIQQPPPEPIKEPEYLPQPPKNAPQSHKVFPTANYTTLTPKGRGNARKRHCRRLGANDYAMLDDAAATLSTIFPGPGKCSTANSPPIGRPQLIPYW